MRHFIVHTRRAGHVVARPLNCGVRRHNLRILKIGFVAILSGGWVVPFFLSVRFLARWNELVAQAGSVDAALAANSFPFTAASKDMAAAASLWAFAAITGWVVWFFASRRAGAKAQ